MLLINVFIKKINEKREKYKEFYSNFRCTSSQTDMQLNTHTNWLFTKTYNRNIIFFTNFLFFPQKICPVVYIIFFFLLSHLKYFFSAKTLQFNVIYSTTRVFTFHLYDCQETKSNRCNSYCKKFFSREILDSKF